MQSTVRWIHPHTIMEQEYGTLGRKPVRSSQSMYVFVFLALGCNRNSHTLRRIQMT